MSKAMMLHRGSGQRGFSLIELGIVIAVIAILATVVLMGRGFLESSRVSKVVESVDTLAKGVAVYAGANGAVVPAGNIAAALVARSLVNTNMFNANYISGFTIGGGAPGTVTGQACAVAGTPQNQTWQVVITCITQQSCQDLCTSKRGDGSLLLINGAAAAGNACALAGAMTFCFQI